MLQTDTKTREKDMECAQVCAYIMSNVNKQSVCCFYVLVVVEEPTILLLKTKQAQHQRNTMFCLNWEASETVHIHYTHGPIFNNVHSCGRNMIKNLCRYAWIHLCVDSHSGLALAESTHKDYRGVFVLTSPTKGSKCPIIVCLIRLSY